MRRFNSSIVLLSVCHKKQAFLFIISYLIPGCNIDKRIKIRYPNRVVPAASLTVVRRAGLKLICSGIEVVITGLTRNRVGLPLAFLENPLIPLRFRSFLRLLKIEYLRFFYAFSIFLYAGSDSALRLGGVENTGCSGIEVVITSLTRNHVICAKN